MFGSRCLTVLLTWRQLDLAAPGNTGHLVKVKTVD